MIFTWFLGAFLTFIILTELKQWPGDWKDNLIVFIIFCLLINWVFIGWLIAKNAREIREWR